MRNEPSSTTARHPVAGEVGSLLLRASAPDELATWAEGKPIDRAWDECPRADWLAWLAAVDKVPLVALVDGARTAVERVVELQTKDEEPLRRAIEAAEELKSNAACRAAATECEALAGGEEMATYRKPPNDPHGWAARAAAFVAEAADALLSAEAKRGAELDLDGIGRGAAVGVGEHVMKKGDLTPIVFDIDNELAYGCVAAVEGCLQACARALTPEGGAPEAADEATETIANDVFEVLDPVRDGMKRGTHPQALVRRVAAKLYVDEGGEPLPDPKKPMNATAAAVLVPVGGGHYHAGHSVTGLVLTIGVALQLLLPLPAAWPLIVIGDAIRSRDAVRRRNAGDEASNGEQLLVGTGIVGAAYALAYLLARLSS